MSLFIVDDQLAASEVYAPLRELLKSQRLQQLRPREHILDDRVPQILLTLDRPTFVTIDGDFWDRRLCHSRYCILYFSLATADQGKLPDQLRRLLRKSEFRTRAGRMGKVIRAAPSAIDYWEHARPTFKRIYW